MPVGIHDAPEAPAVLVQDCRDFRRARGHGSLHRGVRVGNGQEHAHRPAAERLGAEVRCAGDSSATQNFVAGGQLGDDVGVLVRAADAVQLARAEGRLVELDRRAAVAHGQLGAAEVLGGHRAAQPA